ncbi:hypothetical protein [Metaclostridioides mangenotii]|uniref:hypothetical protein n=1 Tax=Metaclostridioides mangenotii TaxID=1540 RepID=UPI000483B4E7|nr:hypothetical protein [Clostridioides mangenotii]
MTEADIIATTYEDEMIIWRKQEFEDDAGVTDSEPEKVYDTPIKCAVDTDNVPAIGDTETANIVEIYTLTCRPDVDLKIGDKLEITFGNKRVRTFIAGDPFFYDNSHLETPITLKERH